MALLESLRRRISPAPQERQNQTDRTTNNRNRVLEVGEDFVPTAEQLGDYRPDLSRQPIGAIPERRTVLHAEDKFPQRGTRIETNSELVTVTTPVEGKLARPVAVEQVNQEQDPGLIEKRRLLVEQARADLQTIQQTLRERLDEQSGFLNRLRKMYESVTGTAKAIRAHMQDVDKALQLSARTTVGETDVRSIRLVVKQMQETYGITTAPATTRSTEARPVSRTQTEARGAVAASIVESGRMTDLSPEQRQAKLIEGATLSLQHALNNPNREAGIKQAASGMVQVNQMIEQLMLPSKNRQFRLPEATANVIQDIHGKFSPMVSEIINKKPDPKIAPTLTDLAGKTLGKEFDRFSRFTENLGSVSTASVDNNPTVTIEARGQLQQLMEAMFNSRLSHLREAIQNNQPDRIINVVRDINRSLQKYDLRDIPESVVEGITQQLAEARSVFQRPAVADLESIYRLRLDMTTAENAFNIFRKGYEQGQATRKRVADIQNTSKGAQA